MTLPAWSAAFTDDQLSQVIPLPLPAPIRRWAWGGASGAGVKVAVIDSGVDTSHPAVGPLAGAVAVEPDAGAPDGVRVVEGPHEDLVGHGTACAAIIRSLAPEAEIYSVRVLGPNLKGRGRVFYGGIRWALDAGMDVVNMSLSSSNEDWFAPLHEIADEAYFRNVMLVCAANNRPGPTYPSEFASVLSVAAHPTDDPESLSYNVSPPVEFGARGLDVEVAWTGQSSIVASGNSFATPHVAGMVARIMSKHPDLTPFQVKAILHAVADNAIEPPSADAAPR
jgi:subtilisin family serine protease